MEMLAALLGMIWRVALFAAVAFLILALVGLVQMALQFVAG